MKKKGLLIMLMIVVLCVCGCKKATLTTSENGLLDEITKEEAATDDENAKSLTSARINVENARYSDAINDYDNVDEELFEVSDYHNFAFAIANDDEIGGDISKAFELYEKAYEMGDEAALSCALATYITKSFDNDNNEYLKKIISKAIETNDEKVCEYFKLLFGVDADSVMEKINKMSDTELRSEFLNAARYYESEPTEEKFSSTPTSTRTDKYEYVGVYNFMSEEEKIAGSTYIFKHYRIVYPHIEVLDEKVIEY